MKNKKFALNVTYLFAVIARSEMAVKIVSMASPFVDGKIEYSGGGARAIKNINNLTFG